jgi:glycosyltransferase involved in cell wall biosynthesis
MDVLLIGPSLEGGEGVYTRLIRAAAPPGVSYAVSDGFHEGAPGATCSVGTEVALNRIAHPLGVPDIGFRALRLRRPFDLVHVHAHPVRLTGLGSTPLVMSEGSSSAVYLGEYLGWDEARIARGYRRARRLYRALGIHDRLLNLERVSRAYVFSGWARDVNLRWGADPAKLEVLAPGFPTPPAIAREGDGPFTFLFAGGDFERKGGFDLVEAFARVSRRFPDARLTLAGADPAIPNPDRLVHSWVAPGRKRRVLDLLNELERRGSIERLGAVDQHDLHASVYPGAEAFVMPSLAEGFGFTNIEAMSHGLPVISTRVGPIAEIVEDRKTGLLVAPGDVEGLANAMETLIADQRESRRMGEQGRQRFLRDYTLDGFRERLAALYDRAIES